MLHVELFLPEGGEKKNDICHFLFSLPISVLIHSPPLIWLVLFHVHGLKMLFLKAAAALEVVGGSGEA